MRITERALRRIIRETLLHETRITPDNLPNALVLTLKVSPGGNTINVRATRFGDGYGTVEAHRTRSKMSPCRDAYEVTFSRSLYKGLGPLLYDIVMEVASEIGGGLMSDRMSVSDDAQRVWRTYQDGRTDVERAQLDSEENELTPTYTDNCDVEIVKSFAGDEWYDHPLAGVYRKPGMETIRRLVSMKRLQVDGMDI